ncbi:MAG: glycosyltransferase family 4 protein [Aggregatilineales bacterium]
MRILFITHYYAPDSGAAANRLTQLAEALHARGHEVTVLTTMPHYPTGIIPDKYRGRFTFIEERNGVRVIQIWLWVTQSPKISRRLISQLSFMLTCAVRGMFVRRPDVIFIENQPIFTGVAGWFISKVKRRPYMLNVSDYWPEYLVVSGVVKEQSRIYQVFKGLANLTQRGAGGIVAMLDDLLKRIEHRLGTVKNGRVIHNGIDLKRFHPNVDASQFRQKYTLGNYRLVTFLGGLGPHIDLETMLEATKLVTGYDDVRFLFVGTGAQKNTLIEALQKPKFSHCLHIEWLGTDEIPAFWGATGIHFWALHDNELDKMRFQAKLYEALATGTPTVIAVDGLMSEVLAEHDMGLTVAPSDATGLANAIKMLLDDAELSQKIRDNARHYAETNLDFDKVVAAYEMMLKSALG